MIYGVDAQLFPYSQVYDSLALIHSSSEANFLHFAKEFGTREPIHIGC